MPGVLNPADHDLARGLKILVGSLIGLRDLMSLQIQIYCQLNNILTAPYTATQVSLLTKEDSGHFAEPMVDTNRFSKRNRRCALVKKAIAKLRKTLSSTATALTATAIQNSRILLFKISREQIFHKDIKSWNYFLICSSGNHFAKLIRSRCRRSNAQVNYAFKNSIYFGRKGFNC